MALIAVMALVTVIPRSGLPARLPGCKGVQVHVPSGARGARGARSGPVKAIIHPQAPNGHISLKDIGARYPVGQG